MKKPFKFSLLIHVLILLLLILVPMCRTLFKKEKKHEIVTYVSLQEAPSLPEFQPVDEIEIPEPPQPEPPPEPEIAAPIPEPVAKPVAKPKPTSKPKATPRPKPTPKPKPTRRPEIKKSTKKVRRTSDAPKPPARKKASADDIEKLLKQGMSSSSAASAPSDIPAWYYHSVQKELYNRWQQPSGLSASAGSIAQVTIRVTKNGTVSKRTLTRSSGIPILDNSVMQAVNDISKFPALPPSFKNDYTDITVDFELSF